MSENTDKKADYKILSNQSCPDCGFILKQNKIDRNHKYCFHCFKLRNGKRYFFEKGIHVDRLEIQRRNRIEFGWRKN